MRNGGGPACLRLRVVLSAGELQHMQQGVLLTEQLYIQIEQWIARFYRDRLDPVDLADPQLLRASRQALDELSQILGLGAVYSFQREVAEVKGGIDG